MRPRLAATAVLALVLGACGGSSHHPRSASPRSSSPAAATSAAGTPTPSATATSSRRPSASVPAGFHVVDATFVSTTTGWLLGTAPCAHEPCTSIVRTDDGGRHWTGVPAPVAYLRGLFNESNDRVDCAKVACISGLRFASPSVGYAYGTSALFMTTDGGHTWRRQPVGADALEAARGAVLRVREVRSGCPGCVFAIERAAVGGARWSATSAPQVVGDRASLSWSGRVAAELVMQNPAGGAGDAHSTLVLSVDGGATWVRHSDPCGGRDGQENDAIAVSTELGGSVVALCEPRGGAAGAFVMVTTDDGAHWRRAGSPGAPLRGLAVTAATSADWYVAGLRGGSSVLLASFDAGRSWQTVRSAPAPSGVDRAFVGFETASVGRYFSEPQTLWSTTDAGRQWSPYTFR